MLAYLSVRAQHKHLLRADTYSPFVFAVYPLITVIELMERRGSALFVSIVCLTTVTESWSLVMGFNEKYFKSIYNSESNEVFPISLCV